MEPGAERNARARVPWPTAWKLYRRFWPYLRHEKRRAGIVGLLLLVGLPASIASPFLVRLLFDDVLPRGDTRRLLLVGAAIVGITLLSGVFSWCQSLVSIGIHTRVRFRLLRDLFHRTLRLPLRTIDRTETGYLMSRIRDDVLALDTLMIDSLVVAGVDLLRAVLFLAILLFLDPGLALSGVILIAVIFLLVILVSPALRRRAERAREADALSSGALHESLSGLLTVRTAAQETGESARFLRVAKQAIRAGVRRDVLSTLTGTIFSLTGLLGVYVIVSVGAYRISVGSSTIGNLFAFFMFLMQLMSAAGSIFALVPGLQKALASFQRVLELLDEETEEGGSAHNTGAPPPRGHFRFEDVCFRYETDDALPLALSSISLEVEPGTITALVGRSGAGKTTLVHLVPRLREPTSGTITLDGRPLDHYPLRWLREKIGVVPQDVFLFDRTIRENLSFARPDATAAEIEAAARAANAHDFVMALPRGYDTVVGERGVRLSGGEKQRIAIARELLRDPPILILDEATSNLDSESEALIRDALRHLLPGRTSFVIAHRLSTIMGADRILVLDQGKIVSSGTHRELLAREGIYRELHALQFGAVENGEGAPDGGGPG